MRTLLLFALAGCNFSASSKVDADAGPEGMDSGDVEPADTEDDTGGDEADPLAVDDDSDGYTENQGDCDDTDETIFPGAEDVCDGISNDCDEDIDEDALDEYEPNDTVHWSLGIVGSDTIELDAFLHSEDDIDRFDYSINDGFIDLVLGIRIALSGFTSDIAYKMTIVEVASGLKVFEEFKTAGVEELVYRHNDSILGDESGMYQIQIKSLGGYGCSEPYTLTISEDSFLP